MNKVKTLGESPGKMIAMVVFFCQSGQRPIGHLYAKE